MFLVMDLAVLQQLPETTRTNFVLLLFWMLLGVAVGAEVWLRKGPEDGIAWLSAYAMEIIFSIDRVFLMILVFATMETPRRLMSKSLFMSMIGGIIVRWCFLEFGWAITAASLQVIP